MPSYVNLSRERVKEIMGHFAAGNYPPGVRYRELVALAGMALSVFEFRVAMVGRIHGNHAAPAEMISNYLSEAPAEDFAPLFGEVAQRIGDSVADVARESFTQWLLARCAVDIQARFDQIERERDDALEELARLRA